MRTKVIQSRKNFAHVIATLMLLGFNQDAFGQGMIRDRIRERLGSRQEKDYVQKKNIAGLNTAIWSPAKLPEHGAPIIVFSHGFHGVNVQSGFLMKAFADAGFIVVAPNHRDAMGSSVRSAKTDEKLTDAASWNDKTHKDRADDISNLLNALHKDPKWNSKIDWSKLVLVGHSLGGYTALGLAGAWPSWKIPGVKAVVALSPYCQPFARQETLHNLKVPVMYQSGTTDFGVNPCIKRSGGAFDQTPSPAIYVSFDRANHFAFTNINRDNKQKELISSFAVSFLSKFVLADTAAKFERIKGVRELRTK